MSFRAKDEPLYRAAMFFHSFDTKEEAKNFVALHTYSDYHNGNRPVLNGWGSGENTVDDVFEIADKLNLN